MKSGWMPNRATSHAVAVVPMLAPITMPIAWLRLSRPAWVSPTIMTVMALDDCMIAVAVVARRIPRRGEPATRFSWA